MLFLSLVWSDMITYSLPLNCNDLYFELMQGIRKICFELLDLKDAVENLCSNTRTKYLAFLRCGEQNNLTA